MLRFLLDTNLCLRVLRDRPAGLRARFNAEAGGLCLSDVVLFELLHGAERSARPAENRGAVERFAARLGGAGRQRGGGPCRGDQGEP